MSIRSSDTGRYDGHFRVRKDVVFIFAISLVFACALELLARVAEYIVPPDPSGATLDYVTDWTKDGALSEADQLKAEHRYLDRYTRHDPYLVYSPVPGWQGRFTHFNSLGFRGPEISEKKPPEVFRVVVFGGSAAFGAFVKDQQTLAAALGDQLGLELRRNLSAHVARRVEVINAAIPGYVSTQELISLQLKVLPLNPDLVIFFDSLNDIFERDSPPHHVWGMEVWESRCSGGTSERIGPFLKQKSAVVRFAARGLAEYRRGHAQPGNRALPPGALAETTGVYLDNMRSMLAILTSRDINSLIILQPARVWYEAHVTDLPAESIQAMSSMRDAIKQGIAQDLVRFGAHVRSIDMDDIGRMPQLFSDSMHFTESGNRTVATRIAKYMINENILF